MADNVIFQSTVATPPSGTVVSTEEITTLNGGAVSAQHVQRIAVAIRTTDGVAIDLPGDATNGLDTDVTRVIPGTGATHLGKAEDAAHASGDTGVMALGVRKDADGAFGADGDYAPLQFDDNGFLKVNIKAGAGSGGTAMTDDAAFTPGTTSVTPIAGFFDDVSPDSVNEGDAGAVRMSGNRNLYIQIRDGAGNERSAFVNANGQLLVLEENSGDILNELSTLSPLVTVRHAEDAAHVSGDFGVLSLGVRQDADSAFGGDGDYAPFQFDASGFLKVNIKAGAGSGGTAMTDDAAFTPGTTSVTPIAGFFDDVAPDSVNEGDAGAVRMSGRREMYIQIRDAGGNERGANVDGQNRLQTFDNETSGYLSEIILAYPNDDSGYNVASDRVAMIGGLFNDVAPDSVSEGDAGAVRMSGNRNLYVTIRDAAGNERGLNIDTNGALAIGSIIPGTGATHLGKAEDAAHASGDTGVMALGVRKDADGAFGADGDYAPFQFDDNGFLKVNIKAGAGSGGTSMTDDAAFTPGTTSVTPIAGFFDDVAPDSVNEGDAGAVRMSGNRNLYIQIRDGAGNERSANVNAANELLVKDTDVEGELASANAILADILAQDTLTAGATKVDDAAFTPGTSRVMVMAGTFDDSSPDSVDEGDAGAVRMSGNRNLYVTIRDAAGNERGLNIDANGAIAVAQATASNLNAQVVGNVAHDAADSGNPIKIGLKAVAHGSSPTAVAAADRTDWYANRHGIPFVIAGHPNIVRLTANYTTAQTDTVLQAISAGQKFIVTQVSAFVDNATTVDVGVLFEFDDGTDVRFSQHPGLAAGSGYAEGSGAGILAIGGDGQDVLVTCEVPTTGSVTVAVTGYIVES